MTAEPDLLPLPEYLRADYKRMATDSHEAECKHYARANVAHATAARDAEIARWKDAAEMQSAITKALLPYQDEAVAGRAEIEALRAEVKLLTHKVITCGVAADHPDQNLTRTGAYASEWNSQQAERVRGLRSRAERLAEALREVGFCGMERGCHPSESRHTDACRKARAALEQENGRG